MMYPISRLPRRWFKAAGPMLCNLLPGKNLPINTLFCSLLLLSVLSVAAPLPADVRVVIDISGSMKQTDPQNLRVPALNLVIELLPDGSRSGVWTFGQYVNTVVPPSTVNSAWRQRARAASSAINSSGQRTNLTDALEKAALKTSTQSGYDQSVILLTDGKIDMAPASAGEGPNLASRERLFKTVLPAYKAAGIKIHTLALSDAADKPLLQQIAMETDGLYLEANSADALSKSFLKAFERAAPAEEVGLKNNRFNIDNSIREFTALVFRQPGGKESRMISPSGKIFDLASADQNPDLRWHRDVNFDLVTIKNPEAGDWQVDADIDPDNRVRILSDLSLDVQGIAATLFSGDPLELVIALHNEGMVVKERALLQLTDFTLSMTSPDGHIVSQLLSDPEKLPVDGVFQQTLARLTQPGEYRFEIQAQGRTFNRQRVLTANLSEPFDIRQQADLSAQQLTITVTPQSDAIDTGLSRVLIRVINPDNSSVIYPMDFDASSQSWHYEAMATQGDGHYEYELNIRGVSTGGKSFRSQPEIISVDFPLRDAAAAPVLAPLPLAAQAVVASAAALPGTDSVAGNLPVQEAGPIEQTETPVAPAQPKLAPGAAPDPATAEPDDGQEAPFDWMLWGMIGGGSVLLLLLLGGLFWWLRKRKKAKAVNAKDNATPPLQTSALAVAGAAVMSEAAAVEPGDDIQEMDDFEAFMSAGEEQIAGTEDSGSPDTFSSDTDINPLRRESGADEALAENLDDQDWGEFDVDEEDGKNK